MKIIKSKYTYKGMPIHLLEGSSMLTGQLDGTPCWVICGDTLWFSPLCLSNLLGLDHRASSYLLNGSHTKNQEPVLRIKIRLNTKVSRTFIHYSEIIYLKTSSIDTTKFRSQLILEAEVIVKYLEERSIPFTSTPNIGYRSGVAKQSANSEPTRKISTAQPHLIAKEVVTLCKELIEVIGSMQSYVESIHDDIQEIKELLKEMKNTNKVDSVLGTVNDHITMFKENLKNMGFKIKIHPTEVDNDR